MGKRIKRIEAGRLGIMVIYTTPEAGDSPKARRQKLQASSAARERLNARYSYAKLERMLAANFDDGDLFVTLSYDDRHLPDSRDKAVRKIRRFLSLLRAARKERGQELRYIYVTEGNYPGGRLHHHLVVNGTGEDYEELRRLWIYGDNVQCAPLRITPQSSYEDLASYLTKEPREHGRPEVGERTWTPSLGLYRPEPETEDVPSYVTLTAPPGAVVLSNEGPIRNGYGEFAWLKYLLPPDAERKRPKAKRKRKPRRKR